MPVHAVLCFTRALVAVGQEIRGVKIVQVPRLARLIESVGDRRRRLSEEDIEEARAALVVTRQRSPCDRFFASRRGVRRLHGERPLSLVGPSVDAATDAVRSIGWK